MDKLFKSMTDDTKAGSNDVSEIRQFYAGKTILLTGSTGFMGRCLVEKLLRGCPDLNKIYVIVRPKRGVSMEQRMKTYFDNVLFDKVREMYPGCESKVQAMEGDLALDDLGLLEKDTKILIEEANYVIHNASNVKFTERLTLALQSNVMGTMAMINLAKKCKKVEAFVYVSTAYSHCYENDIEEKAYTSPGDMNMVREIMAADNNVKNGLTGKALNAIIGKFPNTYCFTKATAEGLIDQMQREVSFPCIIYRPSIVISSWKEPLRSWCANLNGPALLFVAYALGVIRAACAPDAPMDFIPVDMSINAIIVAIWDASKNRTRMPGCFVYNYASSTMMPVSLRGFHTIATQNGTPERTPSIYTLWIRSIIFTKCIYFFAMLHMTLHFIPAVLIDAYLLLNRKKMRALSTYKKATLSFFHLEFFMNGNWRIHTKKIHEAIDRMNPIDRKLFFCDVRELDWFDYGLTYWHGLRVYLLKDPLSTVPAARRRLRIIQFLNYILKYTFFLSIAYIIVTYLGLL